MRNKKELFQSHHGYLKIHTKNQLKVEILKVLTMSLGNNKDVSYHSFYSTCT